MNEVMFLPVSDSDSSLFVCLSVCLPDYSKIYERIFMKFFRGSGRGPRNDRLDFVGDPDHNQDTGIF